MTQVRLKVKKGDLVEVMTGRDVGRRGVVQKVLLQDKKLIVDGVNKYRRNVKMSEQNPQGGAVDKILPIHVSNVGVVNPQTDLRPLCANCHAMVHRNSGIILPIDELRRIITEQRSR